MSTDNLGEKMERAAGQNSGKKGLFGRLRHPSVEPTGRLRPSDEVIAEQAARPVVPRPIPDDPKYGSVIDFPQRVSAEPQNTVVIPDQDQPSEYMEELPVPDRPMSRRTFLSLLSGGAVVTAAAVVEAKTKVISNLVRGDNKAYAPGTASNPTERPATQAPTTQEPATQVPTEVPETQVPTEVPATPKPELPLFPEKYQFGENNEYFRQYEGGLFTGVEKGRAEETHISYVSPWDKSGPTFDVEQEVIKGLEVNDPAALEKALWISEELRKSMIEKTDDNGVLTVEDFDRANAKYDALVAEGNTPVSDVKGVVIVNEPPKGLYSTQYNGYGKQKEEGFDRVTAEIFIAGFKVSDRQALFDGNVGMWCAANAQNQLDYVIDSFPVTPEYTAAKLAPIAKRFQTLFTPQTFTLVK